MPLTDSVDTYPQSFDIFATTNEQANLQANLQANEQANLQTNIQIN